MMLDEQKLFEDLVANRSEEHTGGKNEMIKVKGQLNVNQFFSSVSV